MRLKLYRARCVTEAMAQVRAELGPDAIILSTRRTAAGVEMTAGLEPASEAPARPAPLAPLAWHGIPEPLASRLAAGPLADTLAAVLRFGVLPLDPGTTLLLAGPPGAGKTLSVARLATRLVLAGTPPLVITSDGRRAGAAEELAAYTRLLGIDLIVANQPTTMQKALQRRPFAACVLIDTAGANPLDAAESDALGALIAASVATVVLVLPAGQDPCEAAEQAAAFQEGGATHLLPTRLDLARRLGSVIAAAASGLMLSEAGVGPGATDGLAPLSPDWLSARLSQPPQTRMNHGPQR